MRDWVEISHWSLVGSERIFLATTGSRPGDGLADVLFGALFPHRFAAHSSCLR